MKLHFLAGFIFFYLIIWNSNGSISSTQLNLVTYGSWFVGERFVSGPLHGGGGGWREKETNRRGNTDKVDLGQFVCANAAECGGGIHPAIRLSTCPTVISRFDALHSMSTVGKGRAKL